MEKYKPTVEALKYLYLEEQLSCAGIAQLCGVHKTTVSDWLRGAGIPARDKSEATRLGMKDWKPSEEHRAKLIVSVAEARKKISAEGRERQRLAMLGREPPNKGKPWTDAQREAHMAYRQTPEYREQQAAIRRGSRSNFWRGGKLTAEDLRLDRWEWKQRRKECYERDGWRCQDCDCKCTTKGTTKIQAHHLLARRDGGGDELENLVTLCVSCHMARERAVTNK